MRSALRILLLLAILFVPIGPVGRIGQPAIAMAASKCAALPLPRAFTVQPDQAASAAHDGASLRVEPGAFAAPTAISVTPLCQDDLPALDQGMANVTKRPRRGYRFLPHMHFQGKITISLPYDKALIPPGLSEQDLETFYFDEQAGSWKALERVAVDTQAQVVVSLTDHFTDMINAAVTVPDHPAQSSFTPTTLDDIQAADPSSGLTLIDAPQAATSGDANLLYPITLPAGRDGMGPQLGIRYNSGGGNGWLGVGWELTSEAITIDTRWGVPRYDPARETETYVLNGEQLTPLAHLGAPQPRRAEKSFHCRVESSFERIIRHGDRPDNYWWEVVSKDGVRFFYGGAPESGPIAGATLSDEGGNIFKWALREARDLRGNAIQYSYARDQPRRKRRRPRRPALPLGDQLHPPQLLDAPEVRARQDASPLRIIDVFQQLIALFELSHRPALLAYLRSKGYAATETPAGVETNGPGGAALRATFDQRGRLQEISAASL